MLELSLELTSEEGENILGTMYPAAWDEYLGNLNNPVWQSMEQEVGEQEIDWDE
jgi:hypothetical protein